jgi:hypothetical protein
MACHLQLSGCAVVHLVSRHVLCCRVCGVVDHLALLSVCAVMRPRCCPVCSVVYTVVLSSISVVHGWTTSL